MVQIAMKGANEIQSLGAVQTYSRRYLYLAALGIVENDVVDSKPLDNGTVTKTFVQEKTTSNNISAKQLDFIRKLATEEDEKNILEKFGITKLDDLSVGFASVVIKQLQNKNYENNK
jgi:hypothetical protein